MKLYGLRNIIFISELQGVYPEDLAGMQAIFSRTNRRLSLARQRRASDTCDPAVRSMSDGEESNPGAVALRPLQRQLTVPESPRGHLLGVKETETAELLTRFPLPNVPQRSRGNSTESEV